MFFSVAFFVPGILNKPLGHESKYKMHTTLTQRTTVILHIWSSYRKLKHFPKILNVHNGYKLLIQAFNSTLIQHCFCELCIIMLSATKGGQEWLKA